MFPNAMRLDLPSNVFRHNLEVRMGVEKGTSMRKGDPFIYLSCQESRQMTAHRLIWLSEYHDIPILFSKS